MSYPICALCGASDVDVVPGMVEWKVPHPGITWEAVRRCRDRDRCRVRLELAGEPWPVVDGDIGNPAPRSTPDASAAAARDEPPAPTLASMILPESMLEEEDDLLWP